MKSGFLKACIFAAVTASLFSHPSSVQASDHVDGPVSIANQVADIVDLYAFMTPATPNSLTLVLDVYPFVSSSGHFSDRVNYNFILRKATSDGSRIVTDANSEVVISCKFVTPERTADLQVICASNEPQPRLMAQIAFNQIKQPTVGNNMQLFAGRRADPFFLSKDFAAAYMKFKPAKGDGKNVMDNLNCLSIVMNIGINQLFPSGQATATPVTKTPKVAEKKVEGSAVRKLAQADSYFIAVAAESVTFDAPGAPVRRIDRIGRPEITNVTMNMNSQPEMRDMYNQDRPFEVPNEKASQYVSRIKETIEKYDRMDGQLDLSASEVNRLSLTLVDDYLLLDPFTPCQSSSFFEIERALFLNQPHQSCGGRDLNDNVVNKLYTLYQKGFVAMPSVSVSDGLKGPSKPLSPNFPYLSQPYDGAGAWLAEKIANAAKNFL